MAKIVDIRLTATETASAAFKKVEGSAKGLIGTLGGFKTNTMSGFAKAATDAERLGPSLDQVGKSAKLSRDQIQDMGVALTTLGASLAAAGQLAMTHERLVVTVQQAYADSADSMLQFSDTLAAATGNLFNDTDILAGERYFATLYTNYQVSAEQIQQLMVTTADLAAGAGVSFENAAYRIAAAIRGEAEAAEFLGLTMNQQSIDRDNLTLKMSNQEAAQFRLTALHEQAAWSMGTAAAIADTSYGSWARLTNQFKDAGQAVGAFIGPYGAMIAGLGTGAVGLAQFAGGFTALAQGIKVATTASLAFMATPLGIGIALVGGTLALATAAFLNHRQGVQEAAQAWEDAEASAVSLQAAIRDIAMFDWDIGRWADSMKTDVENEFQWLEDWLPQKIKQSQGTGNWVDDLILERMGGQALWPKMEFEPGWDAAYEQAGEEILNAIIPDDADRERFYTAMSSMLSLEGVLGDTHFAAVQSEAQRLFDAFNAADGAMGVDEFNSRLENLIQTNREAAESFDGTRLATNNLAAAQQQWQDLGAGSIGTATEEMRNYEQAVTRTTESTEDMSKAQQEAASAQEKYDKEAQSRRDQWESDRKDSHDAEREAFEERKALIEEAAQAEIDHNLAVAQADEERYNAGVERRDQEREDFEALVEERKAAAQELIAAFNETMGTSDPLSQWNMSGLASEIAGVANAAQDAGTSLETMFRVVVGNTEAIASQATSVADWIDGLVGVQGEWGEIDALIQNGFINQEQYNGALESQGRINTANYHIQNDVMAIQAMQAPLIAAQTEALETQMHALSNMPPELQLTALAWMDAETSSKAFEIQALASAAALGELGPAGEASVTSMVEGLTAADPALEALLIDMGLINVEMDALGNKTMSINFEGANEANQIMQDLTQSIIILADVMDDGTLNGSVSIQDDASGTIESVMTKINDWGGIDSEATVSADNSQASGSISDVMAKINEWGGTNKSATVGAVDNASGTMSDVMAKINDWGGTSRSATVGAIDNASGTIGNVASALANLPSSKYIDIVTNYVQNFSQNGRPFGPSPFALGGTLPAFAGGGSLDNYIPFVGAEGNRPEMLHFAGGGMAPIFTQGVFAAPPATYVSPHSANPQLESMGGLTVNLNGSFYGSNRVELQTWLAEDVLPAFKDEIGRMFGARGR